MKEIMVIGFSELQKAVLKLAITLDSEHKQSKWQREPIIAALAAKRTEEFHKFFGFSRDAIQAELEHATTYYLEPIGLAWSPPPHQKIQPADHVSGEGTPGADPQERRHGRPRGVAAAGRAGAGGSADALDAVMSTQCP